MTYGRKTMQPREKWGGMDKKRLRYTVPNSGNMTWRQVLNQLYSYLNTASANEPDKIAHAELMLKKSAQYSTYYITVQDFSGHNFQFMRIVGGSTVCYFNFLLVQENNSCMIAPSIDSNRVVGFGDESSASFPFDSLELWY